MLILQDASSRQWLQFTDARHVIEARRPEEVLPALQAIEQRLERESLHAAGFLSYEAAPAFDPAFRTRPPGDFPLLWFGLFPPPRAVEIDSLPEAGYSLGDWHPSVAWPAYEAAIARIKDYIARGETYQVNYTLRLRTSFEGDALSFFRDLAGAQPAATGAFVDTGRFAICSASPELFFRLDGERILARPMKGTAARGRTLAEDREQAAWLQASEKNRAENVMIVDMLRNDLGRIAAIGSVQAPRLFEVERYPTLWQMTSTVSASTNASLTRILAALFPCASITGAPKVRTMGIIAELEPEPRRVYTGCIGFIAPGRVAQFNVAIRTVLVDRQAGQAEYGLGGGVVWDSSARDEYAECQTKARLLTHRPHDFSLLEALLWTPQEGFFLLSHHFKRLSESAGYFGFPLDAALLQAQLDELAASLPPEPHKVRLALARDGRTSLEADALAAIPKPEPARLRLAAAPVDSSDVFLYHKTTHRRAYEAALAGCGDCDDVLLWNERGEVTETDTANVVVELDGQMVTPPLSSGLLPGVFRSWLLEEGQVRERVVKVSEAGKCDRIFLVNSIRKWREAVLIP